MEQSEDTALQIERCVPGRERPRDKALELHCGHPHPELETSGKKTRKRGRNWMGVEIKVF